MTEVSFNTLYCVHCGKFHEVSCSYQGIPILACDKVPKDKMFFYGDKTMTKNWYDDLTDEQIEFAKNNRVQLRLLTFSERSILEAIEYTEREYFNRGCEEWKRDPTSNLNNPSDVVRLRPDWKRPEPEKKGRYVEVDVEQVRESKWYKFKLNGYNYGFHERESIHGYMGVKYKGVEGWCCAGGATDRYNLITRFDDDDINDEMEPAIPEKILFYVKD